MTKMKVYNYYVSMYLHYIHYVSTSAPIKTQYALESVEFHVQKFIYF